MKKTIKNIAGVIGAIVFGAFMLAPIFGGFVWLDYTVNSWRYNAEPTGTLIKICIIAGLLTWIVFLCVASYHDRIKNNKKKGE